MKRLYLFNKNIILKRLNDSKRHKVKRWSNYRTSQPLFVLSQPLQNWHSHGLNWALTRPLPVLSWTLLHSHVINCHSQGQVKHFLDSTTIRPLLTLFSPLQALSRFPWALSRIHPHRTTHNFYHHYFPFFVTWHSASSGLLVFLFSV